MQVELFEMVEVEPGAGEILIALEVREHGLGSVFSPNGDVNFNYYVGMSLAADNLYAESVHPLERKEAIRNLHALRAKGQEYFAQGYRIATTSRFMAGIGFDVPQGALAWRLITAGYIAGSEQRRVRYVYRMEQS